MSGLGRTTRMPECRCPFCGHKLDGVTSGPGQDPDATPRPGDVTYCIQCAGVLVFEGDPLSVRKAAAEEVREIMAELPAASVLATALAMLHHGRERPQ